MAERIDDFLGNSKEMAELIANSAIGATEEVAQEYTQQAKMSNKTKQEIADSITSLVKQTFAKAIAEAQKTSSKSVKDKVTLDNISASFSYEQSRNKNNIVVTFEEANKQVLELKTNLKDLEGTLSQLTKQNKEPLLRVEDIASSLSGVGLDAHSLETTETSATKQTRDMNQMIAQKYDTIIAKARELIAQKREELQGLFESMDMENPMPTDTLENMNKWLASLDWDENFIQSDVEAIGRTTSSILLLKQALANFNNSQTDISKEFNLFEQSFLTPTFSTQGSDIFSNFVGYEIEKQMDALVEKVQQGNTKNFKTRIIDLLRSMSNDFLSLTFERDKFTFSSDEIETATEEYSRSIDEINQFYNRLINSAPDKIRNDIVEYIKDADKSNPFKQYAEVLDIFRQSQESIKDRKQALAIEPIEKTINDLFKGLEDEGSKQSSLKSLKKIFNDLKKEAAELSPDDLKNSLSTLVNIRNIWSKFISQDVKVTSTDANGKSFKGVNIAGVSFENLSNLSVAVKELKQGKDLLQGELQQIADTDFTTQTVDVFQRVVSLMSTIDEKAKTQTTSNTAKKDFQKAAGELKGIFDTMKTTFKDIKPEALIENVNALSAIRNIWSKLEQHGVTVGEFDINGTIVKSYEQLNTVIQFIKQHNTDLSKAVEETKHARTMADEILMEGEESVYSDKDNDESSSKSIAQKIAEKKEEDAKAMEQAKKAEEELEEKEKELRQARKASAQTQQENTEVGNTAKQVQEDTKQLEQANKKAEEEIAKTEAVQKKASNTRKKKTAVQVTPTENPAEKVVTGQDAVNAILRIGANKKSASTPPNTPPNNGGNNGGNNSGNNGGVRVDYVTANDNLDISLLVAKIQEKLDEHPFVINNITGAPSVQITNVKEQVESTVSKSTETVNKSIDSLRQKLTEIDNVKFTKLTESFTKVQNQVTGFKDKITELKTEISGATNDKTYSMPKMSGDKDTVDTVQKYSKAIGDLNKTLGRYMDRAKEWNDNGVSITLPKLDVSNITEAGTNIDNLSEKTGKLSQSITNLRDSIAGIKDLDKIIKSLNTKLETSVSKKKGKQSKEENTVDDALAIEKEMQKKRLQLQSQMSSEIFKSDQYSKIADREKVLPNVADVMKNQTAEYKKQLEELKEMLNVMPESYEEIAKMYEEANNKFQPILDETKKLDDNYLKLENLMDTAAKHLITDSKGRDLDDGGVFTTENTANMKNYADMYKQYIERYNELIKATTTDSGLENSERAVNGMITDVTNFNKKLQEFKREYEKIQPQIEEGALARRVQGQINGNIIADDQKDKLREALAEYNEILARMREGTNSSGEVAAMWRQAQGVLLSALGENKDTAVAEKNLLRLEQLGAKLEQLMSKNSKVKNSSLAGDFEQLSNDIDMLKTTTPTVAEVNALEKEYERLRALMFETGNNGRSNLARISSIISNTFRRVFAGDVTYRLFMKIREIPTIVREIDTAMTDLKRVTSETGDAYDKFLNSAITKSRQLGATVTETIKATSSFGRLGYSLNEAATLAESALVYKNVGWLDIETATNDLVSAMKAFNITAEDSLRIVDTFNILGNKFALTSADVGTGLKQSASALSVANNSFEESAAMLTAITEITQDASSAGNALKTLSLRIRSTKAELSEMGEDAEGAATTTAKLRKQIKGITGVDILKNNNEFKSTYEIMQGIAKVWKDLSDTEQASVLESLAGKVRANQVAALLNNWSQAEKALDESLNSSGTALKENDLYLKSAEGRLSQLKATAQKLSLDMFNSDELKGFLILAKDLLKTINKMGKIGTAPAIAGIALAGSSIKNPNEGIGMQFARMVSGQTPYAMLKSKGFVNGQNFDFSQIKEYMDMSEYEINTPKWNKELQGYVKNLNAFSDTQQKIITNRYTSIAQGKAEKLGLEELGVATVGQTVKMAALNVVQTAWNALVGAGIGFVVQLAITGITKLVRASEEARQATLDNASALKEEVSGYEEYNAKITELKTALEDSNLTQEEAYEKRKELLSIQDEIIDKYGIEKEKIDLLNGSIEENISLLQQQSKVTQITEYNKNRKEVEKSENRLNKQRTYNGKWFGNYVSADQIDSELKTLLEEYGIAVNNIDGKAEILSTKNDLEMYKTLDELTQKLSNDRRYKDLDYVQRFVSRAAEVMDKINDEQYQDDKRILEEFALPKIYSNNSYSSLYEGLQNVSEDYTKAVEDGNAQAVQDALEKAERFKTLSETILADEDNYAVKQIFDDLFEGIIGNKKENLKYTMDEGYKQAFTSQLSGMSDTEVKTLVQTGTGDAVANLKNYAEQAGISVEDLIDVLTELGIVEEDLSVKTEKARPFKAIIEDVEEAQKALTAYDNAIVKMQSPDSSTAFLTADELNTLLTYDDTLVESVKKTAKGYEISAAELSASRKKYFDKQREDIQANIDSTQEKIEAYEKTLKELETKQTAGSNDPDLGTKITNTKNNIAEQQKELAAYRLTLAEMKPVLIDFRESVNTITSRAESLGQSVADMKTQQEEFNHITDKTALSFISNNENWEDFIELQEDGHYHLKETTDDFEALVTESIGYNNVMARLKNQEQELDAQSSRLKNQMLILAKSGKTGSEEFIALQNELKDTETDLADTGKQVKTLEDLIKALMKAFSSSKAVTDFNNQIKDLKYQLDMGEITQAQYNEGYDQYLEELRKNATDEDKDTLRDAEVTARQQKIAQATSEFEKAQKRIDTAYEQGNISLEQKIAQRRALAEQYYGASSEFGNTEESKEKYQDLLNEIYSMEVDSAQKSYDERKKLVERNTEDHIINIDQEIEELKKLNEEYYNPSTGKLGKTRNALDSKIYEENLREIQGKIKEAYDYWTKEDERAKNMGMMTAHEYWDNQLKLADKYYKDIPQFADEYRDIQDAYNTTGQQEMYEEDLRLADNAHSLKLTNEKQYWGQRRALAEQYYKNNKAFEKEWIAEDIAYRTEGMRAMYEEDVRLSENAYKRGEISLSAHIQNQINSWKVYYKDKAELREEDLAAQESIKDQYKNGVQEQINALETLKGQQTQQLNDEIDLLEESKAEYERVAQEKEKAIDKEIRALQRQKDAIEKKKKVEEEDYELQKAMMNLYKASMSTRLVYTGGGWELRRDEQKYQDAIKDVDEKKKENQTKQLDTAIQALQDQKTAISDSTQDIVDQIDKDIVERQLAIKSLEAPFDNLIKILTAVMAQMSIENLDPAFLMQIMNSPAGKDAMEQYSQTMAWITSQNKKYAKTGNKAVNEYYSYYPNQRGYNFNTQGEYYTDKDGNRVLVNGKLQGNVSSSNYVAYAQATREALKVAQDSNTSANTKELLNNFIIDLQKSNMTNEEFMKWMDTLAADSNMTTEDWMKKFGLYDLMVTPFNMFDQMNGLVELGRTLQGGTEEQTETTEEQPKDVLTTTQGIYSDTSNILKIISDFNKANPNLFVGTEGSKVSTTTDVKGNAGKIADTINNSPVFNINVTGNADKSIVSTMRKELTNAFNEYTDMLTGALGIAHQRQLTT